jgi:hypothetical protein
MHIALADLGLDELLNHVSHDVTRQVSRVSVYHSYQGAIDKSFVWQVGEGLHNCLHCLVSLVLHGLI